MRKRYGRILFLFLLLILSLNLISCEKSIDEIADYPLEDIELVVTWPEGGMADDVARNFAKVLEKYIDTNIIVKNVIGDTGAINSSGAIGVEYVQDKPSDGYTLLLATETTELLEIMNLSELSLRNFDLISMLVEDTNVIISSKDSKYETLESLLINIREKPGEIKIGYPGAGTGSHIQALIFKDLGLDINMKPYNGDDELVNGVKNNEIDFAFINYNRVREDIELEELNLLGKMSDDPDVDIISVLELLPELEEYMPVSFPNIIVIKKDTDKKIREKIEIAVDKALKDKEWNDFIEKSSYNRLDHMTEIEIKDFWDRYRVDMTWLLYDTDIIETNPEDLGIERYKD